MNLPVAYIGASFRYFAEGERHVTRFCDFDVLLLVFDGVLRFEEDGAEYEISAGSYHIQKAASFQRGAKPSDKPKYFYVHFRCSRAEQGLSPDGKFDCAELMPLMQELQRLESNERSYTEKCAVFFEILSRIYRKKYVVGTAERIAMRLRSGFAEKLSLNALAAEFGYSKNQVINIFRKKYGVTPFKFLSDVRLKEAEKLLSESDRATEAIAEECGFSDYSSFYKVFYRKNSLSPSDWRKRKSDSVTVMYR